MIRKGQMLVEIYKCLWMEMADLFVSAIRVYRVVIVLDLSNRWPNHINVLTQGSSKESSGSQ
jgi:hypothetical protein